MKVAILPVTSDSGSTSYHAISGNKQSVGNTAGQALDALTEQLVTGDTNTVVILQYRQPDQFFNAQQQERLANLMDKWRALRDKNQSLTEIEQRELEKLIEAELLASAERTKTTINQLPQ